MASTPRLTRDALWNPPDARDLSSVPFISIALVAPHVSRLYHAVLVAIPGALHGQSFTFYKMALVWIFQLP
jgi:hypothetical protein